MRAWSYYYQLLCHFLQLKTLPSGTYPDETLVNPNWISPSWQTERVISGANVSDSLDIQ